MAKLFLLAYMWMLIVYAKTKKQNKAKPIVFTPPPPGCLQSEDCSPTEPAPPEVSWTCLLNSAVHHELCLHVYLNAVTPPSCSVLYSVHTELWGSEVSPLESPVYQTPLFWVSIFTFLQFLPVSRQVQVLGSHVMGMAAKSPFSDLICFGSLAIGLLILFSFSDHQLFPSLILCTLVVSGSLISDLITFVSSCWSGLWRVVFPRLKMHF